MESAYQCSAVPEELVGLASDSTERHQGPLMEDLPPAITWPKGLGLPLTGSGSAASGQAAPRTGDHAMPHCECAHSARPDAGSPTACMLVP